MNVKSRLMLIYGLLIMLAVVIVAGNLIIFKTIENDSNFINYSGRLRATSYKMAQLSNLLVNNNDKEAEEKLERSIQYFDSLIIDLPAGDYEGGTSAPSHKDTIERLVHVKTLWDTRYKLAYNDILINKDVESLGIINGEVENYVDLIDEMVTSYSEDARFKVTRARNLNRAISIATLIIAIFSFRFIDNGVRRPIDSLMKN